MMNKQDLIEAVKNHVKNPMTNADATRAVNAVFDAISNSLAKGESVAVSNFGTFSVKARAAREARNPQTGGTVHIPAKKAPSFKAGKNLKNLVNQ